jgi:polyphosphate glucokinase
LGREALEAIGKERWNQSVRKMIYNLEIAFNYDALYLGGGNAKYVYRKLPSNVRVVSNECGVLGGVRLWVPNVRLSPHYLNAA